MSPLNKSSLNIIKENDKIILTGFVEDVRPYLLISDVFVFPTYREGFPLSVMQAGLMNLPSIVTDVNGCNEIINHKENGLIIPSQDIPSLYNSMSELYTNKTLYASIYKNCRKIIVDNYNQKLVRKSIVDEYFSLLSNLKK